MRRQESGTLTETRSLNLASDPGIRCGMTWIVDQPLFYLHSHSHEGGNLELILKQFDLINL